MAELDLQFVQVDDAAIHPVDSPDEDSVQDQMLLPCNTHRPSPFRNAAIK